MGLYDGVQKMDYVKCEYWLADLSERCLDRVRVEGSFTVDEFVVRVEQVEINNGSVTYFAQTHLQGSSILLPSTFQLFSPKYLQIDFSGQISLQQFMLFHKRTYPDLHPPRGLSSLDPLPIEQGSLFMVGQKIDSVVLKLRSFSFAILGGFVIEDPETIVTLNEGYSSEIQIFGRVSLNGTRFEIEMLKGFESKEYEVQMRSKDNLGFYTVQNTIVPAISLE